MQLTPEFVLAGAVAAVVFLAGILYLRARAKRTRSVGWKASRGPGNLRFTCAGCSQQFTHSRRTLVAWRKGERKFLCKACHTKGQASHSTRPSAQIKR